MARPQKTDQQLLVSVLERYFAEVVFGDPSVIRFTDLEKYAASQGISAKEYEFRRNKAVCTVWSPRPGTRADCLSYGRQKGFL